ncbi:MAG: hypothetical protein ACLRX7_09585 [Acutalibacteraceae bacterium]
MKIIKSIACALAASAMLLSLQRAAVLKQPIPAAQAQTWLKLV